MKPGDAAALTAYVVKQAPQYQLDPAAVLAVAMQEGIGGGVGDNGTSFGPWQLHQGGAYPAAAPQTAQAANAWAWSPAGINYALGRMQSVAGGLRGKSALKAIVYQFERPANPAAEYAAAVKAYPTALTPSQALANQLAGQVGTPGSGYAGPAGTVAAGVKDVKSVSSFLGELTDPQFWIRALEIVGGGVILLLGLYLLARSIGLVPSGSSVARTALAATPPGRAALAAESKAAIGG